jgi:hypothetical protein
MIQLRVDHDAAARLGRGALAVVLAPGAARPDLDPLLCLELRDGVLVPPGCAVGSAVALPAGARLLALLAPDPVSARRLLPLLPAEIPTIVGRDAMPDLLQLLATRLQAESDGRRDSEAARDAALRRLGDGAPPAPELLLDLPPGGAAPPRAVQPLGRPAEGLCRIELHLAEAAAGAASLLRLRLVAAGRIRAAWAVPGPGLSPGWLGLDLPEPARLGAAEARLEVACETAEGDRIALSAAAGSDAPLALRAWTAAPGRHVLPRHYDWAAADLPLPGLPLALAEADLASATAEGASLRLVAAGEEPARLMIELPAEAEATVTLRPLPPAPLDLLRSAFALRAGEARQVSLALRIETAGGAVESGWRAPDAAGALSLDMPLPGLAAGLRLGLRNGGAIPAVLEVSRLSLMAGAAGEVLPPPPAPAARPAAIAVLGARGAVALPAGARLPQVAMAAALPQAAAAPGSIGLAPAGVTTWQDVKLQQHMVSPDGGYRHMDLVVTGLVAEAGLWRQLRTKLFDRRGTIGLEFREAKGWPQMFDVWPVGGTDGFGPFWRLESDRAAEAVAALATPHDRALVAALLEVLPGVASRGATLAGLAAAEATAWAERARKLATAVAAARR